MVTALVIGVVVALLVAAGWWIAQPKLNEDLMRDPEEALPLYSSRNDDGSAGARQHPQMEPAEVAMLRRGVRRTMPLPGPEAFDDGAFPRDGDYREPRTPTAPQDVVRRGVRHPPEHAGNGVPEGAEPVPAPARPPDRRSVVPVPAGTVQFLPGRMEVLQGREVAGQELRFIRPDSPAERPSVTFGRGEGPPYRHVQLRAPTVSRMHARIVLLDEGVWTLENLSKTNPIILNGAELAAGSLPEPLTDGDRIEMGEVVLRYRAR